MIVCTQVFWKSVARNVNQWFKIIITNKNTNVLQRKVKGEWEMLYVLVLYTNMGSNWKAKNQHKTTVIAQPPYS